MVSLLFHDVYVREPGESGFNSPAADRYKLTVDEFDAQLRGLQRVVAAQEFLVTVDDGGESYLTLVADRLEAVGWRGHCFVTTGWIGRRGFLSPRQIRELNARGHTIGSHSATHPTRFSACSAAQMEHEWRDSRAALEDVLGHAVETASVPGGYFSNAVARTASAAGFRELFTSEPTIRVTADGGCDVIGRFTIRAGCRPDRASRFVARPPFARWGAWASWNAKKIVKPVLGTSYGRVADWVIAART